MNNMKNKKTFEILNENNYFNYEKNTSKLFKKKYFNSILNIINFSNDILIQLSDKSERTKFICFKDITLNINEINNLNSDVIENHIDLHHKSYIKNFNKSIYNFVDMVRDFFIMSIRRGEIENNNISYEEFCGNKFFNILNKDGKYIFYINDKKNEKDFLIYNLENIRLDSINFKTMPLLQLFSLLLLVINKYNKKYIIILNNLIENILTRIFEFVIYEFTQNPFIENFKPFFFKKLFINLEDAQYNRDNNKKLNLLYKILKFCPDNNKTNKNINFYLKKFENIDRNLNLKSLDYNFLEDRSNLYSFKQLLNIQYLNSFLRYNGLYKSLFRDIITNYESNNLKNKLLLLDLKDAKGSIKTENEFFQFFEICNDYFNFIKKLYFFKKKMIKNFGGHLNHTFFWDNLTEKVNNESWNELNNYILNNFELSYIDKNIWLNKDKQIFIELIFKKFLDNIKTFTYNNSSWAWLVLEYDLITKKFSFAFRFTMVQNSYFYQFEKINNKDTKYFNNFRNITFPIFNIDLWEHSYYIQYKNLFKEYIDNFINIINTKNILKYLKKILNIINLNSTFINSFCNKIKEIYKIDNLDDASIIDNIFQSNKFSNNKKIFHEYYYKIYSNVYNELIKYLLEI